MGGGLMQICIHPCCGDIVNGGHYKRGLMIPKPPKNQCSLDFSYLYKSNIDSKLKKSLIEQSKFDYKIIEEYTIDLFKKEMEIKSK